MQSFGFFNQVQQCSSSLKIIFLKNNASVYSAPLSDIAWYDIPRSVLSAHVSHAEDVLAEKRNKLHPFSLDQMKNLLEECLTTGGGLHLSYIKYKFIHWIPYCRGSLMMIFFRIPHDLACHHSQENIVIKMLFIIQNLFSRDKSNTC